METCLTGSCVAGPPLPAPAEVANLRFDPVTLRLVWDPILGGALPATYDVTRGLTSQPPIGGAPGASCMGSGMSATELDDATMPAEGESYWYLVRGHDQCGVGTWGMGFDGSASSQRLVGACP